MEKKASAIIPHNISVPVGRKFADVCNWHLHYSFFIYIYCCSSRPIVSYNAFNLIYTHTLWICAIDDLQVFPRSVLIVVQLQLFFPPFIFIIYIYIIQQKITSTSSPWPFFFIFPFINFYLLWISVLMYGHNISEAWHY